ncbi:MAG: ribosome biogenesis/translation initiation ATPase RLI [archaeon]
MTVEKKRIAVIEYDNCNPLKCGNYLCEKVCPVNRNGKECIIHAPQQKPKISEDICIGCEICQNRCPFGAISIVNTSLDLSEIIHSYGQNAFRLYGLATPKPNHVIGFVGRNGIGKTTIVKILSGNLIPNMSLKMNAEEAKQNVINHYKGKSEQEFFKKLYSLGIKVAVKPQNIELIKAHGTARELLSKIAKNEEIEALAEELNIKPLLDRQCESLSGGEFQKIAIAATGLKKADLYFFDEPTSFLDIKERLRIAKFIRRLAEKAAVIVVEHDLILLDYLSDYVNLMYGKPKVYGFVSNIKTTREGINDYLEGYSKEENYRFRGYSINFFGGAQRDKKEKREIVAKWPTFEKRLGEFTLNTTENSIKKNEVVGVVGPNGIGKTTFMKILAGELKLDNGELEQRAKISYKPQYISYTGDKTVGDLFYDSGADMDQTKASLLKPLEIDDLLEKKAKNISGGELQRVSIALCLSKKADLYLLDEPSAYLDVEQRLMVGKTIRSQMDINDCSSMIIDHDLTFIDFVADKLMVFTGEPAKHGQIEGPFGVEQGMNKLLQYLDITVRRDKDSQRPRINKHDSVLDREQKASGSYYR